MFKYPRIQNFGKIAIPNDEIVAVTEKIHGFNFSFIVKEGNINCCSRDKILNDVTASTDLFKGWRQCANKYFSYLYIIQSNLKLKGISNFQLYGEMFGGIYLETDGEILTRGGVTAPNKDIYYHPDFVFCPFDILTSSGFMDYTEFNELMLQCEKERSVFFPNLAPFFWSKPLVVGSFKEAVNLPVDFPTTIPDHFGLWPIPGNLAEGIVIRTITEKKDEKGKRMIVKRKIGKFSEKKPKALKKVKEIATSSIDEECQAIIQSYITLPRLQSVKSKIGEYLEKRKMEMIGKFTGDVWSAVEEDDDFIIHFPIDKKDRGPHKVFTKGECTKFLEEHQSELI